MHNIKDIRKNIDFFKEGFKKRFIDINLDEIIKTDEDNRKIIQHITSKYRGEKSQVKI